MQQNVDLDRSEELRLGWQMFNQIVCDFVIVP